MVQSIRKLFLLLVASIRIAAAQNPPLPAALSDAADVLRHMGLGEGTNSDLTGRLTRDWQSRRVRWSADPIPGTQNKNWIRSSPDGNVIELPASWDHASPPPITVSTSWLQARSQAYTSVDRALTIVHEYVHMDQSNPDQTPAFEDLAWYQTLKFNLAWVRQTQSEIDACLQEERSPARLEKLMRLAATCDALSRRYSDRILGRGHGVRSSRRTPTMWFLIWHTLA